jgi:glycosyltransferase involved in cell wall biosynthesis
MKKILILSIFPAPYRIDVFELLSKKYDITLFFETNKNESRDSKWFVKNDAVPYYLLSTDEGKKEYQECLKNITDYSMAIAYDFVTVTSFLLQSKCIKKHIPYIINCDGATTINKSFLKTQIKRHFVKHAQMCFAGCQRAKDYFLNYGAKEGNVVVHNFSSIHKNEILEQPIDEKEKNNLRNELKLPDGKIILSVGQFIYRKGYDVLLRAWKDVHRPNTSLYIIGGGPLKPEYEKTIRDNELTGIHIVDYLPKETIYKYMKASDVFILPTRNDIWGLVINEAMSKGMPIITTDQCTAGVELVKNNLNGYIVPINDAEQISSSLNKILQNEEWFKKASNISLQSIQNYTIENIASSHIAIIEQM